MAKFKKVQRELAIKMRIEELLIDHRGFSKKKLYLMAKQYVSHKYGLVNANLAGSPGPTPPLDVANEIVSTVFPSMDRECAVRYIQQICAILERRHIASPAQPEKRDEWVSVDERTPELSGEYIVCFASGTISGNCHWNVSTKAWGNNRDGSSWNITHWQPLPAPPQSGKEGQS